LFYHSGELNAARQATAWADGNNLTLRHSLLDTAPKKEKNYRNFKHYTTHSSPCSDWRGDFRLQVWTASGTNAVFHPVNIAGKMAGM